MSARLLFRQLCYVLAAIVLAFSLLALAGRTLLTARAARRHITTGSTYVVNSTDDLPDADVGDLGSICAAANGKCTLRAAIMQANFVTGLATITVPSGVYVLTRSGDDDATVLGDLDIADDLTIQGAGSGVTIVDGNGAVTSDRAFQILSSAKETSLSGLTIRNGKKVATFAEGGGLYWEGGGGHLRLHNVIFESNTAYYGGGLYLDYSSLGGAVEIDKISVRANAATAAVGGLGANFTANFGGFDLRDSRIYSNTAYEGGGLYFQGTQLPFGFYSARIESAEIYSNTASLSGGIENRAGSAAVPIVVLNSQLHNNHAGYYGGAIGNYGTLVISNTTLDANSASAAGVYSTTTRGGGLYNYEGGQVDMVQSTLSGNLAASGGGIYSELSLHNSAALTLTDSTLSNNTASRDGGGLYAVGGQIKLLNTTLAGNHIAVPIGTFYGGLGGGVYITGTAIVTAHNTLIADNTHRYQAILPEPDDCFASLTSLHSLGFNLIETSDNCSISGTTSGNITGQDPELGPLQNNGGSTQTQSPASGSPAIDHGDNAVCPPVDQRGFARPIGPQCDIGAVEAGLPVYLPLIRR